MNGSGTTTLHQLIHDHEGIRVPLIQRDYAQGRSQEFEVRDNFLLALKKAIGTGSDDQGETINLDFVYGTFESPGNDGDQSKVFEPLDGQQRLTTLFILHWYLACLDGDKESFDKVFCQQTGADSGALSRFTYRVRQSSREFFDQLVRYPPVFDELIHNSLSETILDQPWYFRRWKYDPTVQSALVMIDAIHQQFSDCQGGFSRLMNEERPAITFNFLDLDADEFKLTDDLYIKMNARGKLLTPFETFKARFEELLKIQCADGGFFACQNDIGDGGAKGDVRHFVSWRFDREWTDYFWNILDDKDLDDISEEKISVSNVLDQRIMNLLRGIGVVSLDPNLPDGDFDKALEILRDKKVPASYHLFDKSGCLNEDFTRLLIALMETKVSDGSPPVSPQAKHYFDDVEFLKGLTRNPTGESLTDHALFSAYVYFIKVHGSDQPDALREWMRVMRNLMRNSRVERTHEFKSAPIAIQALLPHAKDILSYLRSETASELKFTALDTQFKEECLKAHLLGAEGTVWRELIDQAESHVYFKGQIFFLLEFSGVYAAAKERPVADWSKTEHEEFQHQFRTYLGKAQVMFNSKGLNILGEPKDLLWERALLTEGDYMIYAKSNFSFLHNATPEETRWKRLLSNTEDLDTKRLLVRSLWNKIDLESDIPPQTQLTKLIDPNSITENWRALLVSHPEAIAYCKSRYIRYTESGDENSEPEIYLFKKERIYAAKAELRSYCLFLDLRASSPENWEITYKDYTEHPLSSHLLLKPNNLSGLSCCVTWRGDKKFIIRLEGFQLAEMKSKAIELGFSEASDDSEDYFQKTSEQLDPNSLIEELDDLLSAVPDSPASNS